jgi:hypothetical protein
MTTTPRWGFSSSLPLFWGERSSRSSLAWPGASGCGRSCWRSRRFSSSMMNASSTLASAVQRRNHIDARNHCITSANSNLNNSRHQERQLSCGFAANDERREPGTPPRNRVKIVRVRDQLRHFSPVQGRVAASPSARRLNCDSSLGSDCSTRNRLTAPGMKGPSFTSIW